MNERRLFFQLRLQLAEATRVFRQYEEENKKKSANYLNTFQTFQMDQQDPSSKI